MLVGLLLIGSFVGALASGAIFAWTGVLWHALVAYPALGTTAVLLLAVYFGLRSEEKEDAASDSQPVSAHAGEPSQA